MSSFKFNLIFIHYLTVQFDCYIIFTKFSCILLYAPSLKRPLEIGKDTDGLYYHISDLCKPVATSTQASTQVPSSISNTNNVHPHLHPVSSVASSLPTSSHACNKSVVNPHKYSIINISSSSSEENISVSNASTSNRNMVETLWHNRLGHVPFAKMKGIHEIPAKFNLNNLFFCPICLMAR